MLISKNWLLDFIKIDASTKVICDKLTALGLEVEGIKKAAPDFNGVVIGKVLELKKHPNADKLNVAKVDIGNNKLLQIVCGAPNVSVDVLYPVATVGARLPKNFKIKKSKIRGLESQGMLCSERELGLSDEYSNLMDLPDDMRIGEDFRKALDLDDEVIDISITPNRGDCLSILGVARELSVIFDGEIKYKNIKTVNGKGKSHKVNLNVPKACPVYIARTIKGINNKVKSPLWLTERLRRAGIRSLSPIVDITNYIMIELGVPMHAFASLAIDGDISVRMAKEDEILILLNEKEIRLSSNMLVIADDKKAIALAGIMGGMNSIVSANTTDIVLEAAWFYPEIIANCARNFNLQTDASYRFERGVDYTMQARAIEWATQLIISICGGNACETTNACKEKYLPNCSPITINIRNVNALVGKKFAPKDVIETLQSLGMNVVEKHGNNYDVFVPSYRFDITIEEDLIEELIRVWGYDNIPASTIKIQKLANQAKQNLLPRRNINRLLVDMGYYEAITYSFIDKEIADLLSDSSGTIKLLNPLSTELQVMRTSLLPSLVKALLHNINRQQNNVRLYEFGNGYKKIAGKLYQTEKIAGIVTGFVNPMQWGFQERKVDFFDIKGDVEQIFLQLGVSKDITYVRSHFKFLHPGQSAEIFYKDKSVGFIGSLHPEIQKKLDIDTITLAFELDIATINSDKLLIAEDISKFPEIRRDVSVVMAQNHQSSDIIAAICGMGEKLITDVQLFDVYIGRNIPHNTKSMSIAIYLQDKTKTLTDKQADVIIAKIIDTLADKFNAKLRG